jgi:hypothetical protein
MLIKSLAWIFIASSWEKFFRKRESLLEAIFTPSVNSLSRFPTQEEYLEPATVGERHLSFVLNFMSKAFRVGIDKPPSDNLNKTILLSLIFCLILGSYILMLSLRTEDPSSTDFFKFYHSAKFFVEGKSIYTPIYYGPSVGVKEDSANKNAKPTPLRVHPNLNSPLHTLTILPFAFLRFRMAFWAWSLFSLGAGFLAVLLISKLVFRPESQFASFLGLSVLLLFYFPALVNVIIGQYGFMVLAFAVLLWSYARDRRSLAGGIVLGLAISLKIFFAFFFIFFAARREWRLISTALISFIAVNLLGLFIFGFQNYHQYLVQHSAVWLYINASWNASILAFFTRIFGGASNVPLVYAPSLGFSIAYGLCLLLIAFVIWISTPRKYDPALGLRFDLGFSISLIAMLLISPYGWIYYFPCLILPLIIYWQVASGTKGKRVYYTSMCIIWSLSSWPTRLISSESTELNNPVVWFTSAAYYHYALFTFALILIILAIQVNKQFRSIQ